MHHLLLRALATCLHVSRVSEVRIGMFEGYGTFIRQVAGRSWQLLIASPAIEFVVHLFVSLWLCDPLQSLRHRHDPDVRTEEKKTMRL